MGPRDLPPQLKQMQPTGQGDEQGDEGRRRALEAATVARAEDDDWSSIAQSLRESPGAVGPLRSEERRMAVELTARVTVSMASSSINSSSSSRSIPLDPEMLYISAMRVYSAENHFRLLRKYPSLGVRARAMDMSLMRDFSFLFP
jgi:hypothetical protein